MKDAVSEIDCIRVNGDNREKKRETIAMEAQMQLIVNEQYVTDFLYSTGVDEQLVIGYLLASGLIKDIEDIDKIEIENEVCKVWVSDKDGKEVLIKDASITISHRQLIDIRSKLLDSQPHHLATRGFHGAILWELSTGKWFACEDIGRHNAVDKVIGYGLQNGFTLSESMVLLSGRLVSDIVTKCRNSGIPLMASMTVATDGGIRKGVESNMTIIGGLSEDGFWLYNEGVVKIT
jgi:FdhD protein